MRSYLPLRRRSEFGRVRARGRRRGTPHLTLFALPSPAAAAWRVGFAIPTTVGAAVVRNRLRRRLRAILDAELPGRLAADLVIVARPGAADLPFAAVQSEVRGALDAVGSTR